MSDFDVAAVENKESTALFIEGDTVEVGKAASTHNIDTYIEQEASIRAFLAKPVLLSSGNWTQAVAAGTDLWGTTIGSHLNSVTMWKEKIKGFRLFKGDFVITVRLNASAFQQGKLILHYVPFYNHLANSQTYLYNGDLILLTQHPNVQVDCRGTSYSLRIPYVAPSHYFDLVDQKWGWGSAWLTVLSSLKSGTATTDVDYTIYGCWENVKLCAPTLPQGNEMTENKGPIAAGLRKASKVMKVLGQVPLVSSYTEPLAWATNIAADAASALGWSKPRELEGVTTVAQQTLKYAGTADGPDIAMPGGITTLNRIETVDYLSYTNEDEMSMDYLKKIPYFVGSMTFDATSTKGADLISALRIVPSEMRLLKTQTYNGKVATYALHAPVYTFSRLFDKWRGGFKLLLKFVKTEMHTGRLEVTWTPGDNPTVPTYTNSEYSLRTIIDIRGEDEVEILLPYLLCNDYNLSSEASGKVCIRVLDRLRAPDTCAQNIQILAYLIGADDLEFACPSAEHKVLLPFSPQSDEEVMHSLSLPKMSNQAAGGLKVDEDSLFHAKRSMGEQVLSIKQLLMRMSPLSLLPTGIGLSGLTSYAFDPHSIVVPKQNHTSGALESGTMGCDIYNIFAPWFMFWRGSKRFHTMVPPLQQVFTQLTNGPTTTLGTQNIGDNSAQYYGRAYTVDIGNYGHASVNPMYPINAMDVSNYSIQHVPYYNKFMCSSTRAYDGTTIPQSIDDYPNTNIVVHQSIAVGSSTVIGRSVSDDFQFTFFVNATPTLISIT